MSNKRYYWLKLKEDFFEQDEIKVVESMENGKDYIIFYLKLVLKSINTGGELRFKEAIPYDDRMLSTITGTNIDVVRSAIKLFTQLGMIEVWDDGTLYMLATEAMIGSESSSARRVRRHREKKAIEQKEEPKALQCNGNETKSNTDIDTDKERDTDTDIDTDKTLVASKDAQREQIDEIVEMWNQIEGLPQVRRITETSKRYKYASARLKEEGFDTVVEVIQKVASSDFLRGKNRNNWTANFEWAMTASNFIKILEDTYINKESNHEAGRANNSANKLERIYEEGRRAIEEFDFENFDGTF